MGSEELWTAATAAVKAEYCELPSALKGEVATILHEIGCLKEMSASLVDAGSLCEECRGLCCRFGRHHFSVVDLLGYLVGGEELFTPDFANPSCPYQTGRGCIMEPAQRPFNCIIFICQQVEDSLDDAARQELAAVEQLLRLLYGKLEKMLGNRFENGLLITYERGVISGEPIFRY